MGSSSTSLPHWAPGTAGVLCTSGPHAIPVSTAVRAGDERLLFALGPHRQTLARLREDPRAALCMLGEGLAFTAHGRVSVLREEMGEVPIAALDLSVEGVQDHLADGRTEMLAAPRWRRRDQRSRELDRLVLEELRRLAGAEA